MSPSFAWCAELYGLSADRAACPLPARVAPHPAGHREIKVLVFNESADLLVSIDRSGNERLPTLALPTTEPETQLVGGIGDYLESLHLRMCDCRPCYLWEPPEGPAIALVSARSAPETELRMDRSWDWAPVTPEDWPDALRDQVDALQVQLPQLEEIAVNEVDEQSELALAYWLHRHVVKPSFGRGPSKELRQHVLDLLGDEGPIIDFSAGDDTTVLHWRGLKARELPPTPPDDGAWAVANDVAFCAMDASRKEAPAAVFFTNHDLRVLGLKKRFRTGLLKNTLHHLPDKQSQLALVNRLLSEYTDRLVLVEIQDPQETGIGARLWNLYYRRILGDQGDEFLTEEEFLQVVGQTQAVEANGVVKTSRGNYLWAVLESNKERSDA